MWKAMSSHGYRHRSVLRRLCATRWIIGSAHLHKGGICEGFSSVSNWGRETPRAPYWCGLAAIRLLAILLLSFSHSATASDAFPLRSADRSSPRAALEGFVATLDIAYSGSTDVLTDYSASGRLYMSQEEYHRQKEVLNSGRKAAQYLDLSHIPPALQEVVAAERILQLKEILDRIILPASDAIPDQAAMARTGVRRWRLPDTEIDFVLVEDGPRRGEFLVSADTVDRLPEFYLQVKDLPYKAGPAARLNAVYRTLSQQQTDTIYDAFLNSPLGLALIVPPRWLLSLPGWAKFRFAGAIAWQWLGLAVGALLTAASLVGARRLARRLASAGEEDSRVHWQMLPVPLTVLLLSGLFVPLLCAILRIGGTPRIVMTFGQDSVFFLAAAWLSVACSIIVGEIIVASEHLNRSSLDSQLVLLGTRFFGLMIAVGCLILGADELGFPAYSVIAGLGVGGLAIALAARDAVANFLGSILIMFEKPFRIGHVIRVGGSEGNVENVGFRSTRIRTLDNSLVSIPSNVVVNATVENLTLRPLRRQRFFIQVTYDTPQAKLKGFIDHVRRLILEHPHVDERNVQVRLNNFAESSLDIIVLFHLSAETYAVELQTREEILLQIIAAAEDEGVEFAFPTRSIHLSA